MTTVDARFQREFSHETELFDRERESILMGILKYARQQVTG
jgi:hypothetical protein